LREARRVARIPRLDNSVTCWSLIRGAAECRDGARAEFARRYSRVIRGFFRSRWRGRPLQSDVDDAVQEVFVDCFRAGGALERANADRGGFRPFLRGVARHVALRFEERARRRSRAGTPVKLDAIEGDDEAISRAFDREWAQELLREAAAHMTRLAEEVGPEAGRRVDLLRLRFRDGLPIREIATRWDADAARLHREYAKARKEFHRSLLEVAAFHYPVPPDDLERECRELLALLARGR